MNKLLPFDTTYLKKFEIFADLTIAADDFSKLSLIYKLRDELNEVEPLPSTSESSDVIHERKDELWKSTCFEMFLNPVGHKQYYEFNFSPEGAWNCYHFAGYRFPQPPVPAVQFEIERFAATNKQLEIRLINKSTFRQFNVGLTAVVKNKNNQVTYFSLKHENSKPDFHVADTFILQRG